MVASNTLYYSTTCAVLWSACDINLDSVYKQVDKIGYSLVPFLSASSQVNTILCSPVCSRFTWFSPWFLLQCLQ